MELSEIMAQKTFVVVGNTLDRQKFAYKIKTRLLDQGYTVYGVGKELASINDVPEKIDIIDLCIHPAKGLKLIQACQKPFQCIVIQPGAEGEELLSYLDEHQLPYIKDCLLVGMQRYC